MALICISGLDKVELLFRLWKRQVFTGKNGCDAASYTESAFDRALAARACKQSMNYFHGKAIKVDISGDHVDPWLYDRDAGAGAFALVVEKMKSEQTQ